MKNHYCFAKNITQLVACHQCGLNQICCKQCFSSRHRNQNNSVHPSGKLVDSEVYTNFLKLIHVEWLVGQKVLKSLGGFSIPDQNTKVYIVNAAFYGSDFYKQLFQQQKGPEQYVLLKTLYGGNAINFQSLSSLEKILNDSKSKDIMTKYLSKLTEMSEQQKIMNGHLDFYIGADIYYLSEFVAFQQQIFAQYIAQIAQQQNQQFSIFKFIEWRQKSCQKQKNPIYYSKEFVAFLVEYYRKDASEKGLYSMEDFSLNYWEYFHTSIQINPTLKEHFESQVGFYKQYEKLMTQNSLNITYLGFKVWKLSNGVSKGLPYLKNHYFLFAFTEGYLNMLIERTYSFLTKEEKQQHAKQSWADFVNYIKDYSVFLQQRKSAFQFQSYRKYFLYRKRMQPFHKKIKQSKQNIYDKEVAVRFLNNYFQSTVQLKPKMYKQFLQKWQVQQKQKQSNFLKESQDLRAELQAQEKDHFYDFVYMNFVTYCGQQDIKLKKDTYYLFKKNVLQTMDEKYIQETEERFKRGDYDTNQEDQDDPDAQDTQDTPESPKVSIGQTGAKIVVGMDKFEEEILQENIHENEDSDEGDFDCPCCHRNPDNCQSQECQIMGYCTSCSL